MRFAPALLLAVLLLPAVPAGAQAKPIPGETTRPAKELFGAKRTPGGGPARSIGFYSKGCIAGAVALPVDGPNWQAMRLSRNRNWGHPALVSLVRRIAGEVQGATSWPGLLVGDMSQPRGGPMLTGHASHQVGLDADIWLNPMPPRRYSNAERESVSAVKVVAANGNDIDPRVWTPDHLAVIRIAARQPEVERVLVNAAIKKALCREAKGDRSWLRKVRPYWGHDYHMHVRMRCPADAPGCRKQAPVPPGEGCDATLAWWFSAEARKPADPHRKPPPLMLSSLPGACRAVLSAP